MHDHVIFKKKQVDPEIPKPSFFHYETLSMKQLLRQGVG